MKLRSLTIILLLALTVTTLTAVANTYIPETEWEKTFGGSGDDYAYSVQQTDDGGYIIAGLWDYHWSQFGDAYLIKTDADGNLLWERTFGGPNYDQAWSVLLTSDGGYILAGEKDFVSAGNPQSDAFLIKTDEYGNQLWEQTFDRGTWRDWFRMVQKTNDGGYILIGATSNGWGLEDVYLVKTDANGLTQWEKTFGGGWTDNGESVQQTTDGGYIIAGLYNRHDAYLIKTYPDGNLEWERIFSGGSSVDQATSVKQTPDGGYIVAGYTESYGAGGGDAWLIKTDSDGIPQWDKTFGGSQGDMAASVLLTDDGGYIFTGRTRSYGAGDWDVYLVKTDSEGNLLWQKTFGGSQYDSAFGPSVFQQTSDGGFIITGGTRSFGANADVYLIKVAPNTPVGDDIIVNFPDEGVSLTFEIVTTSGTTTVDVVETGPPPPSGFRIFPSGNPSYYDITTTAGYTGTITIVISYDETQVKGKEENLALKQWDPIAQTWIIITMWVDTENNFIYGQTTSLSMFAVMEPPITATTDIDPDTLNLKSNGQWITAYIELPEGYSVEDIDLDSVELLHDDLELPAVTDQQYDFVTDPTVYIVDHDGDGVLERLAKFDRVALVEHLGAVDLSEYESGSFYDVSLMVSGELSGGPLFVGSDTIRVKQK